MYYWKKAKYNELNQKLSIFFAYLSKSDALLPSIKFFKDHEKLNYKFCQEWSNLKKKTLETHRIEYVIYSL